MNIIKIIGISITLLLLAFLSYLMLTITLEYFPIKTDVGFLRIKQWVFRKYPGTESKIWFTSFYIHVATSMFVLFAGFTQFFDYFYRYKIHKLLGKIYVFIVLFLAAPSGFIMGIYANGGIWSQVSFIVLSVLWWISTFWAFYFAAKLKFDKHRIWIIISYALTLSALTLRAWKWGITNLTDWDLKPMELYRWVAWLGWVPNLAIAFVIIRLTRKKKS